MCLIYAHSTAFFFGFSERENDVEFLLDFNMADFRIWKAVENDC